MVAEAGSSGGWESRFRCKSLVGARWFESGTSSPSGRLNSLPVQTRRDPAGHEEPQELRRVAAQAGGLLSKEPQRSPSRTGVWVARGLQTGPRLRER